MKVIVAVVFCFTTVSAFSQKRAIGGFAEIGGPGLASANFDMRFKPGNQGLGFRVGVGGMQLNTFYGRTGVLTIPAGVNYLFGKDSKHFFEVGAGATYININEQYEDDYYNDEDIFRSSFGHLWFGYRRQPAEGGFLFRAGICPVFGVGFFVPYYAGIGFGYKF